MSALRVSGVTIWRQIAEELEDEIASRTYAPGGRLPTEMELSARFGVNRHTVRRAIATLEDRGLVRVERGRGTFVQTDTIDYVVGRRTRFSENLRRLCLESGGNWFWRLSERVESCGGQAARSRVSLAIS